MNTLFELYRRLYDRLNEESSLSPEAAALEARELCRAAEGLDSRERIFLEPDRPAANAAGAEALLARRLSGEPLGYLLGEWEFYGRRFFTDKSVLIPRDDSVCVLELFLSRLGAARGGSREIADICAGSGCLGLSALLEREDIGLCLMADISPPALELCEKNIALHGLGGRARTAKADVLAGLPFAENSLDGLICNPPYIKTGDMAGLDRSVRDFEPEIALDGGPDGLAFYKKIAPEARRILRPGGVLCFETGFDQAGAAAEIMARSGFCVIETGKDLSGICRAVCGEKPGAKR